MMVTLAFIKKQIKLKTLSQEVIGQSQMVLLKGSPLPKKNKMNVL